MVPSGRNQANTGKGNEGVLRSRILLLIALGISMAALIIFFGLLPFLAQQGGGPDRGGASPPGQQGGGTGAANGSASGGEMNITDVVAEKVATCESDNPALTEEQCWDLKYHDTAIAENDRDLCDLIKNERVRLHCKGYFR